MMIYRKLMLGDTKQIAQLHEKAFKQFFLTSLGKEFLKEFYYSILQNKNSIAIGCFQEDDLIGFAVGTLEVKGFYLQILKSNFLNLFISSLKYIFQKPSIIIRIIQGIIKKDNELLPQNDNPASLLSICVDPNFSDKGIGSSILVEFEKIISMHKKVIVLTTDSIDNEKVNTFYKAKDYKLQGQFLQGARKMNLYIKYL